MQLVGSAAGLALPGWRCHHGQLPVLRWGSNCVCLEPSLLDSELCVWVKWLNTCPASLCLLAAG